MAMERSLTDEPTKPPSNWPDDDSTDDDSAVEPTKPSLTARLRALEKQMGALESNVMAKVHLETDEMRLSMHCGEAQMLDRVIDTLARERLMNRKARAEAQAQSGHMNTSLAALVQQVSFEQMDTRTKMSAMDADMATLNNAVDQMLDVRVDHAAKECSQLPAAFTHLDEIFNLLTIKLEATSEAEESLRQEIAELRSEVHNGKEMTPATSNLSNPIALTGTTLTQLDELCHQLAGKLAGSTDAEADLRQQIAEVRDCAQSAEHGLDELRSQVCSGKETTTQLDELCLQLAGKLAGSTDAEADLRQQIAEVRDRTWTVQMITEHGLDELRSQVCSGAETATQKAENMLLGDFSKSFKQTKQEFSGGFAIEMDLGSRSPKGFSYSGKSHRMKSLPFSANNMLDRAPSCPCLPPLSSVR